ncbi:hypothetical protein [Candidatus Electronema sp. JM]|uniref:hypothetical protein n=1 Tax=Candidatus Electronema sp. JM TaxID=3401571 RepID=UPI003AA9ABE3
MTAPLFDTPMQVLSFIRQCINENNPVKLHAACSEFSETKTGDYCQASSFKALCEVEQSETLEHAFLEERQITVFPTDKDTFNLGGHDLRIHCLHIDLERYQGHWRLKKIWQCR